MKNTAGFFNFILTIPGYKVYSWLPKSLFAVSNANDYARLLGRWFTFA